MRIVPAVVSGRRLTPSTAARHATNMGEPDPVVVAKEPAPIYIRRIDDRRGRLRHRRAAAFEAVDEADDRLALASYDADLVSPHAEVMVVVAPGSGVEGVKAAGSLLRALAEWATVDGLRDLVLRGDARDPIVAEVLEASGLPWSPAEVGYALTAELVLNPRAG
jgi:hypothetical protein